MNDLEIYLKAMAGMFERMNRPSIEAVVLKHGEEFKSPARPRPKGIRKRTNKLCFMNSYHLAESRNMTYVEGFAISKGVPIPLHHAWVVDQTRRSDRNDLARPRRFVILGSRSIYPSSIM